jgi:endonuclease/exonuclease/phosphatase family metal-dependent hydrolase
MANGEDEPARPRWTPGRIPGRVRGWFRGRTERWTHGAISLAIVAALVAVIGLVFTFDYLADRADDTVVGQPEDSDVPYTPGASSPTGTDPTASAPPVSGPTTATAPAPPPPLGSATGQTCVPDAASTEISVLTFNIKSSRVAGGGVQIDTLAQTLTTWKPDIVLLQEVDKNRPISGSLDMPAYLGERLGYYSTFGANVLRPGDSQYGTAILSRFPITASENTLLPRGPGEQQRGLLHAVIDIDGLQLSAYSTHLQHTSADARMRQVSAIRGLVADDDLPMIMGGDFNATPGTDVMAIARSFLTDTWNAVGVGSGLTAPNSAPRVRIDYQLYSGVDPLSAQVLTPPVSDHRAVWATYGVASSRTVCVPVFG